MTFPLLNALFTGRYLYFNWRINTCFQNCSECPFSTSFRGLVLWIHETFYSKEGSTSNNWILCPNLSNEFTIRSIRRNRNCEYWMHQYNQQFSLLLGRLAFWSSWCYDFLWKVFLWKCISLTTALFPNIRK